MTDKLKNWYDSLSLTDKHKFVRDRAILVNNKYKKMAAGVQRELDFEGCRTGVRGGKQTTITAKAEVATKEYYDVLSELKYAISKL